eukprot:3300012-Rhodomonas_salina.1
MATCTRCTAASVPCLHTVYCRVSTMPAHSVLLLYHAGEGRGGAGRRGRARALARRERGSEGG